MKAQADLFAAAQPSLRAAPALMPAQGLMPVPAPMPKPSFAAAPAPAAAPAGARSRPRSLWYAVIFPELPIAPQPDSVLRRLAGQAQAFTSLVSIEPPNALLLEIHGSLRLFGALRDLHARIDAHWQALALRSSSAAAPSTLAALWFARCGGQALIEDPAALAGRLAQLPIACTAWDPACLQTLRAMGVTRLGELLRLPRAGLARRIGPAAVFDLDVALAHRSAPRRAFVPRERFRARGDFDSEIDSVAGLGQALTPLIGGCADFLRERQAGIQSLQLRLRHRAAPATRVRLGLASVTSERRRLQEVLVQRLARLVLPAPVRAVEVISGPLQNLCAASLDAFGVFGGAGGRDTAAQLVERLRARLGEDAVYGVSSISEHRPEAAWRKVRELPLGLAPAAAENGGDEGVLRPVWLLGEPLPLSVTGTLPRDAMVLEQGPERIESGWWDGKGVARDYYVARRARGARLWVFQERHSKRWYLHGVFA